ncbi:34-kDa subunit of RNA polymerase III (C) [Geranomyces variabilis]|nr:34-kDa subunit of RNA polymerase III (C) [Geranomyces variabilis]
MSKRASKQAQAALTADEQTLLAIVKAHPKGVDIEDIKIQLDGWNDNDILTHMNQLSSKQYVDFMTLGKTGKLAFKARSAEEASKTGGMKDEERVIYRLVKEAKNSGIWIKQLKDRSGLHTQLANTVIKNLEKKNIIKWVKPVKTPHKKVYMLFELDPSTELTGGAWYTDNEMDMDFIEQLSTQVYKYIVMKSFPQKVKDAVYPPSHSAYPSASDIHKFISKSGLTTVPLGVPDVQALLDRLYYDGKVTRILKTGSRSGDPDRMDTDFDDDEDEDDEFDDDFRDGGERVRDLDNGDVWMYKAVRGSALEERNAWTDVPCGRCPVREFCKEGGPVNPSNCRYFKDWLAAS